MEGLLKDVITLGTMDDTNAISLEDLATVSN